MNPNQTAIPHCMSHHCSTDSLTMFDQLCLWFDTWFDHISCSTVHVQSTPRNFTNPKMIYSHEVVTSPQVLHSSHALFLEPDVVHWSPRFVLHRCGILTPLSIAGVVPTHPRWPTPAASSLGRLSRPFRYQGRTLTFPFTMGQN